LGCARKTSDACEIPHRIVAVGSPPVQRIGITQHEVSSRLSLDGVRQSRAATARVCQNISAGIESDAPHVSSWRQIWIPQTGLFGALEHAVHHSADGHARSAEARQFDRRNEFVSVYQP